MKNIINYWAAIISMLSNIPVLIIMVITSLWNWDLYYITNWWRALIDYLDTCFPEAD